MKTKYKSNQSKLKVAVVVAHPDDETIWTGGLIMDNCDWDWFVLSLCRAGDKNRAPRFFRALDALGATGTMGDIDDSPELKPISKRKIQQVILSLLPSSKYDLIITHHPKGEYTSHLRHEQASKAMSELWVKGSIASQELWLFAYEDGGGTYLPHAIQEADLVINLSQDILRKKQRIITEIYGFSPDSFEAKCVQCTEAFWQFNSPEKLSRLLI